MYILDRRTSKLFNIGDTFNIYAICPTYLSSAVFEGLDDVVLGI